MEDEIVAPSPTSEDTFYPSPKPADSTTARSAASAEKAGTAGTEAAPEPADTELEPQEAGSKSPRVSFKELRTAKDKAEARAELLEKQLAERNKTEPLPVKPAAETKPAIDPTKPKSEDFATYDEFLDARDKYNRGQWEKEQQAKTAEAAQAETIKQQKVESDKHLANWNKHEEVFKATAPEYKAHFDAFFKVAGLNPTLASAVFESEFGPDLSDYLGAHPEELDRIAGLTPRFILKAIGALEDKLGSKAPDKPITKAPRPLPEVGGKAGGAPKELSIEETFYGKN